MEFPKKHGLFAARVLALLLMSIVLGVASSFVSTPGSSSLRALVGHFEVDSDFFSLEAIPDGQVKVIVATSTGVYVGGGFEHAGESVGPGAPFLVSSGEFAATFPVVSGGNVSKVIADASGGWYIFGDFTEVGGETRQGLAHITSAGAVDMNFDPDLGALDPGEIVSSMVLSPDGTKLYVGLQNFDTVDSDPAVFVFNTATGADVTPPGLDLRGSIGSLAISSDGATLYVGGLIGIGSFNFDSSLSSFNAATGAELVNFTVPVEESYIRGLTVSPDDATLYVIGQCDTAISPYECVRGLDVSDGSADMPSVAFAGGTVISLTVSPDGSTLYAAGEFNEVEGEPTLRLVAITTASGVVIDAFDPQISGLVVNAVEVSSDNLRVYIGGNFTSAGGETRLNFAELSAATGDATSLVFDAEAPITGLALSSSGTTLYAGGSFSYAGVRLRGGFIAYDPVTGDVLTQVRVSVDGEIYSLALSLDGTVLYLGGDFTTVNGVARSSIAAVSTTDGAVVTGFNPGADGEVYDLVLSPDGSTLYAGGNFANIAGVSRSRVAALSSTDGTALSFNPNVNSTVKTLAISPDAATLYIGGAFATVSGTSRANLAAVSTSGSGALVSSFSPNPNEEVASVVVSPDGLSLYVAGVYDQIGGQSRAYLSRVDSATGVVQTDFSPSPSAAVQGIAISRDGSRLYTTGGFTTIGGSSRSYFAELDTSDGTATEFNQNEFTTDTEAVAVTPDGRQIFAGGQPTPTLVAFAARKSIGISTESIPLTEGGASAEYSIELGVVPSSDVTVTITPDAELSVSPSVVTLTPGDWNTPHIVTVTAIDDSDVEGSHSGSITHAVTSSDGDYNGISTPSITVSITDNDTEDSSDTPVVTPPPGNGGPVGGGPLSPVFGGLSGISTSTVATTSLNVIATSTPTTTTPVFVSATTTATPSTFEFTRELQYGSFGKDVLELQRFLNRMRFVVSPANEGSPGKETEFFGLNTESALKKFQEAYTPHILIPAKILKATGVFGEYTLRFINILLRDGN